MPDSTPDPVMAARYGTARPRTGTRVAAGVTIAAFLVAVGYVTWQLATSSVHSQLIGFSVVSDSRVDVTFEVSRHSGAATTCAIRAQAPSHADVGYAVVTITPGQEYLQTTYPLATLARATTAEVLGCADRGPPHVDAPSFAPGTVNPPQQPTIDGGTGNG